MQDYYSIPKVSKSLLTKGEPVMEAGRWVFSEPDTLGYYWHCLKNNIKIGEDSDEKALGRYIDKMLLPCETNTEEFFIKEKGQRTTSIPEADRNKTPISQPHYQIAEKVIQSVREASPIYKRVLESGNIQLEFSTIHEPTGLELKCKLDGLIKRKDNYTIVDLKTTKSTSIYDFNKDATYKYHYDLQAAMYCYILERCGYNIDFELPFIFIIATKQAPFKVVHTNYTRDSIERAMTKMDSLLEQFKSYEDLNWEILESGKVHQLPEITY